MSRPRRMFVIACWAVVIGVYLAAIAPQGHAPHLGGSDKLDHIAAFFTVTVLARLAYVRRPVWLILACVAAFGAFIEFSQMLPIIHRDAELDDWLADMAAAITALIVVQPVVWQIIRYRVREWERLNPAE